MEFRAPLEDILFTLSALGADRLDHYDADLTREIGEHFGRFATDVLAPINAIGDAQGCRLENGRVRMPQGFKEAFDQLAADGWQGLTAPEDFGGQGQSHIMLGVTSEIFSGANHALQMVTGLVPGAIRTLLTFGTEDQKSAYIPKLIDGTMLATMCLTEPNAGSDLARIRTRAVPSGGAWKITGEKIFISGGDQDLTDDIFHLVLARTSDDGLKGLSLFIVTGRVSVTRIEEKMGLHASPTCQIVFDETNAELIGSEGQGLIAMFTMMNHARIDVALQGVAHAARAFDLANAYAHDRVQGQINGSDARLIDHDDVRRMVDDIDALALMSRGIAHLAMIELERGDKPALIEFLTSMAKVFGSEAGIRAAETGMQVLGGYGYLTEYGLDQTYRDARITAIYEGANGIHTRTLATRGIKSGGAEAFGQLLQDLGASQDSQERWAQAVEYVQRGSATHMAPYFYQVAAQVLVSVLSHHYETQADTHPDPDRIRRVARHVCVHADAEATKGIFIMNALCA